MNELSVNNPNLLSNDKVMVAPKTKKGLQLYFEKTAKQVRKEAKDNNMSLNDYYLYLKQLRSEEKKNKRILRQNETQRITKMVNRLQSDEIDSFTLDLDRLGDGNQTLEILMKRLNITEGNLIISALDGNEVKRVWTYNDRMRGVFRKIVRGEQFNEIEESTDSDSQIAQIIKNFSKLKIERVRLPSGELLIDTDDEDEEGTTTYQQNQGGFFKYYHNLPGIDLTRYNIFSSQEQADYTDNCFLVALEYGGATEEVLQIVRTKMKNRYIKNSDIKYICKEANIYIEVKVRTVKPVKKGEKLLVSKGKLKNYKHGDELLKGVKGKSFSLAIVDEHFILLESLPFKISNYCLNHFETVKDNLPTNYEKREQNKNARPKDLCRDSFKLIEKLLDDRDIFLTRIPRDHLLGTQYYDQNKTIKTLTFGDENYESMENRLETIIERYEESKTKTICNIFLDFETNTRARYSKKSINGDGEVVKVSKGIRHRAYLGCMRASYMEAGKRVNENKTFYDKGTYKRQGRDGIWRIVEETPGKQMIKHIANTYGHFDVINLIAHNCGYDMRVGLYPYIYNLQLIENGHQLIVGSGDIYSGKGKKVSIKLKCSYRMIGCPLSKFGKVFGLPQEKEYMPYDLYTTKNIKNRWVWYKRNEIYPDDDYCLRYIKEKDREQFLNNCNKWKIYKGGKIDIIKYSEEYCKLDCEVLELGYEKFREQIKEISDKVIKKEYLNKHPGLCVDIYNQYTISSVANELMLLGGCYEETYRFSGVLREFIQKCVVGGRVMTCDNKKVKIVGGTSVNKHTNQKEYIQDFDGVSLYPSSLVRIPGFIKGLPKILPDMSNFNNRDEIINELDRLSKGSHYFLEINITRVGIKRQFPLMSYNDGLTRKWTNDVIGNDEQPISLYVDRTMIEDWIKFHDVDFKVVRGYYFTDGYNPLINKTMRFLFEERLRQKKLENPIENTYKLCMNSGYGKTLEKSHEDKILYKTEADLNKYIKRSYNFIKDITPTADGRYRIKEWATIDTHFNQVHQGVSVLSMSKRIMNEVMCLAEDKGYGMFYTDTDSIHMYSECVNLLAKDWKEMYGGKGKRPPELIGKYLGQFHNDFDLDGHCKEYGDCKSIKFIALGKKCYLDILEGKDKDGKVIFGSHIRMKGVSGGAVEYQASETARILDLNTKEEGAWEMYNQLYENQSITFDLCKNSDGSEKLCFKFFNDFTIGNMNDEYIEKDGEKKFGFTRTAKFEGNDKLINTDFKNILI